ncbi:hypothetical protein GW846_03430 [Candidatus Gracilibacteria bacterium]|nr:hypothetical protein [Candidatus Gracilibacteria bacterium]
MKSIEQTSSPEEYILYMFQINQGTGFSEDFKTSLLSPLIGYFSEKEETFALMYLGGNTLEGVCNKFSSYKDFLQSIGQKPKVRTFMEKHGIKQEDLMKVLGDILSPYSDGEFDSDFESLRQHVLTYDGEKNRVRESLENFLKKYFPQAKEIAKKGQIELHLTSYKAQVLEKIREVIG